MCKNLILLIAMMSCFNIYGQQYTSIIRKSLLILKIKEFENGYLFIGNDTCNNDTMYFISLKGKICKKEGNKIIVGNSYLFEIEDMDSIKGSFPPALPNGYYIKKGKQYIKRNGRNGKTYTTTQYLALNTKGLFIKED